MTATVVTPVDHPRRLSAVPGWRPLIVAVAVSAVGDQLSTIAVCAVLLDRGSPRWVAAYFVVALGARLGCGSLGGRVADRFDRRRLLVVADVARAGLMALLAVLLASGSSLVLVLVVVGASNACATVHRPAFAAWLPHLVPGSLLAAANGGEAAAHQVAWTLGPPLGGLIAGWASPAIAVVCNGLTFVVAAILTARLVPGDDAAPSSADPSSPADPPATTTDVFTPPVALDGPRGLGVPWWLWAVGVAVMAQLGGESVLHFVVAERRLGLGATGAGWMLAAVGLGGIAGGWIAPRLFRRLGVRRSLAGAAMVMGVAFALLGVVPMPVALALCAVEGAAGLLFDVASATGLQTLVAPDRLGAAFGRWDAVGSGAQLAGTLCVPATMAFLAPELLVCVLGAAVAGVGCVALGRRRPGRVAHEFAAVLPQV